MTREQSASETVRPEWVCVDCWEDPKARGTTGYADYETDDGEVCGYHYGVRRGYIHPDVDGKEVDA